MPLVINPANGEFIVTDDPTGYYQRGYRDPTLEELEQSARSDEFGSVGQQAQAFAERAVRGATLGAVQSFEPGMGETPESRARGEVLQQEHPVAAFAADVLPDVAVSALTGGLGGLATGAGRAAAGEAIAGGAGVLRAGLAAGRAGGVAALAGESLGTGLVSAGQQAAAEGSYLGEDIGRDAENILLWGGLNFGLGSLALRGAARRAKPSQGAAMVSEAGQELDDVARVAELDSAAKGAPGFEGEITSPGLSAEAEAALATERPTVPTAAEKRIGEREAIDDGVQRAVARASRADAEDLVSSAIGKEPEREADSFGRQRRLYMNRDAVMEAAGREFKSDLDGAMGDLRQVVGDGKQAFIAGKVSDNPGAQRAVASGIAKDAAEFAGQLRGEARAYAGAAGKKGLQYPAPGAKGLVAALMDNAKAIEEAAPGKPLFEALDNFKRSAQDIKLSLEAGALNSTNPIHHQQLIPRVDDFEKKIRTALEDSGTWGTAGEAQRAYNAAISDKLMPSLRVFEESVMERTHRGYDALWKMEGWENKIRNLLENTDPGRRRHVAAVFDAMDELASVRRRFGDPKTAERLEGATAKMRRTIGLADEVSDATERMEALGNLVGGGGPVSGAIAGGFMGGLPGAAVGAALPGFARQFVMGDLQRSVNRLMGASEAVAARGVDDWIRSSRVRGAGLRAFVPKLPELSPEARQLRDVAMRRGVSQGMALFMGEDETPGAAFDRLRDALIDDEKFFDYLNQDYGSIQQESPELFMVLSGRAALARQFLIQRMPPNVAVSVAKPNGHPPSREAMEDWAEYVNAVRNPERIAQNLAGISVQQVETLRTIHPRFHELLQQRMLERIATAQQTGEQLDDTFLVRAGLLFPDLDGLASPVFSREFGKVVRDYNAQQKQGQAQRSGGAQKPTPSPMMSTIERGATFGSAG